MIFFKAKIHNGRTLFTRFDKLEAATVCPICGKAEKLDALSVCELLADDGQIQHENTCCRDCERKGREHWNAFAALYLNNRDNEGEDEDNEDDEDVETDIESANATMREMGKEHARANPREF